MGESWAWGSGRWMLCATQARAVLGLGAQGQGLGSAGRNRGRGRRCGQVRSASPLGRWALGGKCGCPRVPWAWPAVGGWVGRGAQWHLTWGPACAALLDWGTAVLPARGCCLAGAGHWVWGAPTSRLILPMHQAPRHWGGATPGARAWLWGNPQGPGNSFHGCSDLPRPRPCSPSALLLGPGPR